MSALLNFAPYPARPNPADSCTVYAERFSQSAVRDDALCLPNISNGVIREFPVTSTDAILSLRDGFQVGRIHAARISAQVLEVA